MNIMQAIKSGKRFRRPTWGIYYSESHEGFLELTPEDLLADDWEVVNPAVTITSEAFDNAVRKVEVKLYRLSGLTPVPIDDFLKELKKELGL